LKTFNSLIFVLTIFSFAFFFREMANAEQIRFVELKGKKAIEQFMNYHFQKENDTIIKQLQKQYLSEGKPNDFTDIVKDTELQNEYLVGYGLIDEAKKKKYVFLDLHQPLFHAVYSVYRRGKEEWFLIGEIPLSCKYVGPSIRYEKCPQMLLISALNGSGGTGCLDSKWIVYAIGEDYVIPVTSYPMEGYRGGWGYSYDVEYKASQIKWYPSNSKWVGTMELNIRYFQPLETNQENGKRKILFEKNNEYFLLWNELKNGFVWYLKDITPADPFADILCFDNDEYFAEKYKSEINKIGQDKNSPLDSWYKRLMNSIKTPKSLKKKSK
jgi:hypothetical protein